MTQQQSGDRPLKPVEGKRFVAVTVDMFDKAGMQFFETEAKFEEFVAGHPELRRIALLSADKVYE